MEELLDLIVNKWKQQYNWVKFIVRVNHDEKIKITITSLQDGRGIIVLKEFANIADTKKYIAEIKGHKDLTKEYVNGELDWFIITQENLNTLYQTNDYNAYKSFYFKNYK